MYTAQCKDVFNGSREKTIQSLSQFKFNRELQEFWESVINAGADLAWMLVALAQYADGKTAVEPAIREKWKAIQEQWCQYDDCAAKVAVEHTTYFIHQDVILMCTKDFVDRCVEHLGETNSPWQAYGYLPFISIAVMVGFEYSAWIYDDADGNFKNMQEDYPAILDSVIEDSTHQYESMVTLRLSLAKRMEVVLDDVTIDDLLKRDVNLKSFRNKLHALISLDILQQSDSRVASLLRALGGVIKVIDTRGQRVEEGGIQLPSDIDNIKFDD